MTLELIIMTLYNNNKPIRSTQSLDLVFLSLQLVVKLSQSLSLSYVHADLRTALLDKLNSLTWIKPMLLYVCMYVCMTHSLAYCFYTQGQ